MAAIDTKSDEQVLEALDFDHEVACRYCSEAATVATKCRGCPAGSLLCDEHLAELRERFRDLGLVMAICQRCGHHGHSLEQMLHIIPIGGR